MTTANGDDAANRSELRTVLDEEIARLPEKFRRPIVLCYLEGMTHDEAATRLRCPVGTVRSRMASARSTLRDRLSRRGLALPAGLFGAVLAAETASAAVPQILLDQHSLGRDGIRGLGCGCGDGRDGLGRCCLARGRSENHHVSEHAQTVRHARTGGTFNSRRARGGRSTEWRRPSRLAVQRRNNRPPIRRTNHRGFGSGLIHSTSTNRRLGSKLATEKYEQTRANLPEDIRALGDQLRDADNRARSFERRWRTGFEPRRPRQTARMRMACMRMSRIRT